MRVLIVSQYFWPESFRINELVQSLVEREVEVDILTGKPNYPDGIIFDNYKIWGTGRQDWHGAKIFRVPIFPRGRKSGIRLAINYLSFVVSALLCGPWLLRKRQYDVIFVYGLSPIIQAIPALFLGWLKNRNVILWVQDLWPESLSATGYVKNPGILKGVEWVVRFIYRKTALILVQSRAFETKIRAMVPDASVCYYPNSGDSQFSNSPKERTEDIPVWDYAFSVTFAGNVGSAQAVEVIIEAATILREYDGIHFVVIGQGSRREWMQEAITQRSLGNVHLLGQYPYHAMPALLAQSSILLVTLKDTSIFNATIPSKLQAYLAAGKPIVGSLNGEGQKIIREANAGLAVPAENAEELAEAIKTLFAASASELADMGRNGRKYYSLNFDHNALVGDLIDHFHSIAEK